MAFDKIAVFNTLGKIQSLVAAKVSTFYLYLFFMAINLIFTMTFYSKIVKVVTEVSKKTLLTWQAHPLFKTEELLPSYESPTSFTLLFYPQKCMRLKDEV